jgi:hypothetical protein
LDNTQPSIVYLARLNQFSKSVDTWTSIISFGQLQHLEKFRSISKPSIDSNSQKTKTNLDHWSTPLQKPQKLNLSCWLAPTSQRPKINRDRWFDSFSKQSKINLGRWSISTSKWLKMNPRHPSTSTFKRPKHYSFLNWSKWIWVVDHKIKHCLYRWFTKLPTTLQWPLKHEIWQFQVEFGSPTLNIVSIKPPKQFWAV